MENAFATMKTAGCSVCVKESGIHGMGLFATEAIPAGTDILEYVGERIDSDESEERCRQNNEYIFSLDDGRYIDGNVSWNPAGYANHSCDPNCEAELREDRIWIVALRDIKAGEELTFNYGYSYEDYLEYPCRCGSPQCVGYMVAEEHFSRVRRKHGPSRRSRSKR